MDKFKNTVPAIIIIILGMLTQQVKAQSIVGEYNLDGHHEMVAAFKFNEDSSFEFYFVYGVVDRMAKGTYTISDNKVLLKSSKIPAQDFTITHQKVSGVGSTVQVTDANTFLLQDIVSIFMKGESKDTVYSNSKGLAHSTFEDCDSIMVVHLLYPDEMTVIKAGHENQCNYFDLALKPSLAEVSFTNFHLTIEGETLEGSLPYLFQSETSVFVKR